MGVKFNAFITPNLTTSTWAKETSLMTNYWKIRERVPQRGVPPCARPSFVIDLSLPSSSTLCVETGKIPAYFTYRRAASIAAASGSQVLPQVSRPSRFLLCSDWERNYGAHNLPFQGTVYMQGATCKTAFHALNLSDHSPPVPGGVIPPFQRWEN